MQPLTNFWKQRFNSLILINYIFRNEMNVMQYYLYWRYHCLVCNYHNKWYDVLHFLTIIVIFPLEKLFGNNLDVINIAISFSDEELQSSELSMHVNTSGIAYQFTDIYGGIQPIYWPKSKYCLSVKVLKLWCIV